MSSTGFRFGISFLLIAVFFISPLHAMPGEDDYRFAMALASNGFMDEANTLVERHLKGANKELAKARILKISGDIERDTEAKDKYYEEALSLLNTFLTNNPGDPKSFEAQFDKGRILQQRGQVRSEQIQKEVDPTKRDVLIAEAEVILQEASVMFAEMFKQVQGKEEQEETAASALFYWGATFYHLGLCYPPADTRRDGAFKKALQKFEDFQWEYSRYIQIINVYKYQGMVHEAQQKWVRAGGDYGQARSVIVKVGEHFGQIPAYLKNLYHELTWRICDMNNRGSKFTVSLKAANEWLQENKLPAIPKEWGNYHQAIVLEKSRSLYGSGAEGDAIMFAKQVAQTGGFYSGDAIRNLNNWGVSDLDPNVIYLQARNERAKGNVQAAVQGYSSTIQSVLSQGEEHYVRNAVVMMKACRDMGSLMFAEGTERKNYYAAAVILETAVMWHQDLKANATIYSSLPPEVRDTVESIGANCAQQRRRTFLNRAHITNGSFDVKMADTARDDMIKYYPDAIINEFYFKAKDIENVADELLEQSKYEEAIAKYQETANEYSRIPNTTDFYERGLLREAIVLRAVYKTQDMWNRSDSPPKDGLQKVAQYRDLAVKKYQSYIAYTKKNAAKEGDSKKYRDSYVAKAAYQIGSLYYDSAQATDDRKEKNRLYKAAVDSLKDYEKIHTSVPEYTPYAAYYETLSLVRLKEISQAQKRLDLLLNMWGSGEAKYLSMACYAVGKETADKEKQAFYFGKWIELEPDQPIANYQYVGATFMALGDEIAVAAASDASKAAKRDEAYRDAQNIYRRLMDELQTQDNVSEDDLFDAQIKLGNVSYKLGDWAEVTESFERIYLDNQPRMLKLAEMIKADEFRKKSERVAAKKEHKERSLKVSRVATDLAFAYFKNGQQAESFAIYEFLLPISKIASERWWICKYFVLRVLHERGETDRARAGLKSLKANYGGLGGKLLLEGRFLSDWFKELIQEVGE